MSKPRSIKKNQGIVLIKHCKEKKTIFPIPSKEIQRISFNCLRTVTKTEILFSESAVTFCIVHVHT